MSLEQSIADLQTQAGLLLDLPQDIADEALAKIALITDKYNSVLASQQVLAYVDAVNGRDTNDGSQGAPLETIGAAVAKTPLGGICRCILMSAYTVTQRIILDGIKLTIESDSSTVKRPFAFERQQNQNTSPVSRIVGGFDYRSNSNVVLKNLAVALPALDGTWPSYPNIGAGNIFSAFGDSVSPAMLLMTGCELTVPTNIYASMFNDCIATLRMLNVTITGNLNGKIHPRSVDTNGIAANTIAQVLRTNLTTV